MNKMDPIRIMIIGFGIDFQNQFKAHMLPKKYMVFNAETEKEITVHLQEGVDVALLNMTEMEQVGLLHLTRIKRARPRVQSICAIPSGKVKLSIASMKHGAFDEIQYPFSWSVLFEKINAAYAQKKKLQKPKRSIWKRIEDHIIAGGLAQEGGRNMAIDWLDKTNKNTKDDDTAGS